jgi:hypothetical protein
MARKYRVNFTWANHIEQPEREQGRKLERFSLENCSEKPYDYLELPYIHDKNGQ